MPEPGGAAATSKEWRKEKTPDNTCKEAAHHDGVDLPESGGATSKSWNMDKNYDDTREMTHTWDRGDTPEPYDMATTE